MIKKKLTAQTLTLEQFKELFQKLPPNVRIKVYIEEEVEVNPNMKPKKKVTLTINDVADMITDLKNDNNRRFDKLEKGLQDTRNELAETKKEMRKGFTNIKTRLDYIVNANNLKDIPNK